MFETAWSTRLSTRARPPPLRRSDSCAGRLPRPPPGPASRNEAGPPRTLDARLPLPPERHRRLAPLQVLHVDARVVAPLYRRVVSARPRRVPQRTRCPYATLFRSVGVVADDRDVRDGVVDAPVDARKAAATSSVGLLCRSSASTASRSGVAQ